MTTKIITQDQIKISITKGEFLELTQTVKTLKACAGSIQTILDSALDHADQDFEKAMDVLDSRMRNEPKILTAEEMRSGCVTRGRSLEDL